MNLFSNKIFLGIPKFTRYIGGLGENPYLRSVQRGLLTVLPLVLTGVFFVCLVNFPSQMIQGFLDKVFSPEWRGFCDTIIQATFGIVSLAVACSIAFHLARFRNASRQHRDINPILNIMVVLSCYIILVGSPDSWQNMFSMSQGLIMAIFAGISASFVFFQLTRLLTSRTSFSIVGNDPATYEVMGLVPAASLTIFFFALLRAIFFLLFPKGIDIADIIVSTLFNKEIGGIYVGILYTAMSQLLWFFGIHGPNVLFTIEQSTINVAMMENIHAALAFQTPPHIVTKGFIDAFAYMGGSGCTLCLILAILYKSRDSGNRRLCYLALIPALFNVNEPLLFGIPLVFNPLYFIPFLITPVLQVLVAYLATIADLIPRTIASTHWTTPALLSGYLATHSLSATALQVVNIIIGVVIYLPFVLLSEKIRDSQLCEAMRDLQAYVEDTNKDSDIKKCMSLPGKEGYLARILAEDLNIALSRSLNSVLPPSVTQSLNTSDACPYFTAHTEHIQDSSPGSGFRALYSAIFRSHQGKLDTGHLFLLFQPQVSTFSHEVRGVECLLHWEHPKYGDVPLQVIMAIAEENKTIDALGSFIFRSACAQFAVWHGRVNKNFIMSVNLSARQLDNSNLGKEIGEILEATGTPPHNLEVELTKSLAISPCNTTVSILDELQARKVNVAINGFWMGHTLLQYLKFPINTAKIACSLALKTSSDFNEHVIHSITSSSNDTNIRTVVEGVETQEQCRLFEKKRLFLFQGNAFSPPLTADKCLEYITSYHELNSSS